MIIGVTSDSRVNGYAATLVAQLASRGHTPAFILCSRRRGRPGWKPRLKSAVAISAAGSWLQRSRAATSEATRSLRAHAEANQLTGWDWPLTRLCEAHGMEFRCVDSMNGSEAVDYVTLQKTDLLINAGGGIFKPTLIQAPRIGILNAHMGALPAFRGMNVLEWSPFHDQPAGVTLHLIDAGIDTGDILLFEEIAAEADDTIASLRAKSLVTSVELMVRAVEGTSSQLPRTQQQADDGKQYFTMHPRLKQIVENKLRAKALSQK
jgi:methionyl-tRNA formyltransferase